MGGIYLTFVINQFRIFDCTDRPHRTAPENKAIDKKCLLEFIDNSFDIVLLIGPERYSFAIRIPTAWEVKTAKRDSFFQDIVNIHQT